MDHEERTAAMADKMIAPELFRPPIDFLDVPYDHLLRMAADRYPDRPAIIYHDLILTYREVVSMVNCIANGLQALSLGKGDIIALFTFNRPESLITLNAAATIGAVVSPMNPAYKEREVAYQLGNCQARAILVEHELLPLLQMVLGQHSLPHLQHILVTGDRVPESMPGALPFAMLLRRASPKHPEPVEISGEDLLALPYSSGTTGLPKGVMLSQRNLTINHQQFATAFQFSSTTVGLIFLPMYHTYGLTLSGSLLLSGGTEVLMERFDLLPSLELCEKHAVTHYCLVPPIVLALLNAPVDLRKMKTVRYLISAAAPLPLEAASQLQEKLQGNSPARIMQLCGMTEATALTFALPPDPQLIRLGSVGMPVHNSEMKIVDTETGQHELPTGEDGEIIIRGPHIMQGYWKAPEETAGAIRNGWLYSGDVGHVDAEGYVYLVDRKKDVIKYKGFAIAPAELESLLMEHPAVVDAAVIGIPDNQAGEVPKGLVVVRPGQSATAQELIALVNGKLATYKKLHMVEFIDAIPRVPSGKILRRVLKERERARRVAQ
jgi:acyl-CoA synthetase (AMP-forming)/AMP-acid ligase II